ncbi:cation transporter [Oculatella sp. LEGE 06141]|uniref:cation diffusion facilitator family transporter n=1 Tax=Oculatella sp. LEGE 06141 TaxID=1828648 RepID=UPI00187E3E1E|nr:cation transporter [Oculatella sp. LEGE 06141]
MNSQKQKIQVLQRSIRLVSLFFLLELGVGLWIDSLSLVVDAGHMLLDLLALGLSLITASVSFRLPLRQTTTSLRLEGLAALMNSSSLLVLAGWAAREAIDRLQAPATTDLVSLPMLITAVIGLGINTCNAHWLHQHCHHDHHADLSLQSAWLHVLTDAVSSLGVVFAAIAMVGFHWWWADSAISLVISGWIAASTIPLVIQSVRRLQRPQRDAVLLCQCHPQIVQQYIYPSLEELIR